MCLAVDARHAQAKTAATLANRLSGHPALSAVLYPGIESHAGHDVALRQMAGGFGGMLSIRMKQGENAAIAGAVENCGARDVAWRHRKPDRAPRLHRG